MWGPALDISAFAGAAAVALTFVALAPWLAPNDEGGAWAFLVFVIGIDVAHVYSTLFRTYFDLSELKRRPRLYALAPLGALLVLVAAGFGFGVHRCVGNRVAEMQLTIIWEEILKRFPEVRLVSEPKRSYSTFVRGYETMPVIIPARN
jgi:hypothetical protein